MQGAEDLQSPTHCSRLTLPSLDPEQKEALIDVVEKLLQDKTTLVAGSAVMAFEQLCPERIDLIHKNFR